MGRYRAFLSFHGKLLIENCRMHGIEPYAYHKDVLERLPTTTNQQVKVLTPLNWQRARQSHLEKAA